MADANELRAALHRDIMNLHANEPYVDASYHLGFRDARHAAAELVLSASHPDDDAEPVTEAWLLSIGFVKDDTRRLDLMPWGPMGQSLSWIDPAWSDYWQGEVVFNMKRWPKPLLTRGDVRRLMAALGVSVKESP